ncbi:hypothetical protein [Ferruginibacter sp. HRS2-29]|uniref:hypothetical protein n=1 Tax=Ferruginibacter sp. HRS2-29 TaxID=2487334 RepID=UPI0020CD911B|nr:hypothetical protein [Ferruginibacter sp. HRS2-29]MCP9749782.1 hypothetical protein [Ferruginibacter sp. HRS2-29]
MNFDLEQINTVDEYSEIRHCMDTLLSRLCSQHNTLVEKLEYALEKNRKAKVQKEKSCPKSKPPAVPFVIASDTEDLPAGKSVPAKRVRRSDRELYSGVEIVKLEFLRNALEAQIDVAIQLNMLLFKEDRR